MRYIVNKYSDDKGRHEVHNLNTCTHLPKMENRILIGDFNNCLDAIKEAKKKWPDPNFKFDGCYHCCYSCHKG